MSTATAAPSPTSTHPPLAAPVSLPPGSLAIPARPGTVTPTVTPTLTPSLTPTSTRTPGPTPVPPPALASAHLRPDVLPEAYLSESCTYLERRWSTESARPGTVVVPIMFHSILKEGRNVRYPQDITSASFQSFVQHARYLGFETITTAELIGFLNNNDPIPPRSMILILDDRRPGVAQDHFMPVLKANDWTLTLAWITADTTPSTWQQMENLNDTGRLDVQSHGAKHIYIIPKTPEEEIRSELTVPISILTEHFGQRPRAFVWPGGNFTPLSVQVAHETGYEIAFTAYSRGPLLYNWIPLGEPERAIGDPLMVLPRYWSSAASVALNNAVEISKEAVAHAVESYPEEAEWYRAVCEGELPPLPKDLQEE